MAARQRGVNGQPGLLFPGQGSRAIALRSESGLLRRYREGEAAFLAYLDDYAFLIAGLTDLYESDFDPAWLKEALRLNAEMVEKFWDEEEGGLRDYPGIAAAPSSMSCAIRFASAIRDMTNSKASAPVTP